MVTHERKNAETKQRSKLSKDYYQTTRDYVLDIFLGRKTCGKNISKEILHIRIKQVIFI